MVAVYERFYLFFIRKRRPVRIYKSVKAHGFELIEVVASERWMKKERKLYLKSKIL